MLHAEFAHLPVLAVEQARCRNVGNCRAFVGAGDLQFRRKLAMSLDGFRHQRKAVGGAYGGEPVIASCPDRAELLPGDAGFEVEGQRHVFGQVGGELGNPMRKLLDIRHVEPADEFGLRGGRLHPLLH